MNRSLLAAASAIVATLVLGACASVPGESATRSPALDCSAIDGEMTRALEAQRAAELQQHEAWKAVVPFAVVARYGKGKAAAEESRQQQAELQQRAASQGCAISQK